MRKIKALFSKSLYLELWILLAFAIASWAIIYTVLLQADYAISYSDWAQENYISKKLDATINEFQSYINQYGISSNQPLKIARWSDKHPLIYFYIEKDGQIIYDFMTDYTSENDISNTDDSADLIEESYSLNPYVQEYVITLADCQCTMHVFEDFQFDLYNKLQNLCFFIGAIVAILIITIFVRKKIHYIKDVTTGINILEAGDLTYQIPVKGNDEITHVAESLNSMRIALSEQMENEKKAIQANNSLVTALSHDLRTPLTTQMGYLEILKEHHYSSPEEMDKYINTALSTCNQIKEMSDRLFEYFLAFDPHPERPKDALETFNGIELFMQLIGEYTPILMEQGFKFNINDPKESFNINVNMDDILRIFNNVFTNIDKYGDEASPVNIDIKKEADHVYLSFTNKIRTTPRKNESAKIGLISISSLMKRQGGSSLTRTSNDSFTVELKFPVC